MINTYNAAGQPVSRREILTDAAGEELSVLAEYAYTYDGSGNITSITGLNTTDTEEGISALKSSTCEYDAENRLIRYNGEELVYDACGNMTYGPVNGVMTELAYDCRNRLISAGGITYTYDGENNRIGAEGGDWVEEYTVDTVSSSLSRVLVMTRHRKGEKEASKVPSTSTVRVSSARSVAAPYCTTTITIWAAPCS